MSLNRKCANALLVSVIALYAIAVAAAQSQPMSNTGSLGGPAYGNQQSGGVDSAENRLNRERDFVKKALEGDSTAAKLGELAEKNSQSDDIKQLGRKMAEERKQLESQIEPMATQLGVTPAADLSRKDKKLLAKLEGLAGPQFDAEFIGAVQKEFQQDLKDFNSEAEKTQNSGLRDVAKDGATVISQYLQLIQAIAKSHNVQSSH
jgi:putative membrane protein